MMNKDNTDWVKFINNPDPQTAYWLGGRDTIAGILAKNYKAKRLPELAEYYVNNYEKHFSHDWHTGGAVTQDTWES